MIRASFLRLLLEPPDPYGVREVDELAGRLDDHPLASLDPLGLDSNRYRCCGNGVVSNVAEWIGRQLLAVLEGAEK